ncbi:MAG: hypothetical protein JW850_20125 [Thermoflexales bacterium]|nr:hypothetical protein [Thermoflexales bacterium]
MENELGLDVRQVIDALLRRWRLVASLTLGMTLVAAVLALAFPSPYRAVAGVAIVKIKTSIEFDSRFKTTSEDTLGSGYAQAMGAEARRQALAGLVENGSVAYQVIEEMGDMLRPSERTPALLLQKVSAGLVKDSDLIHIHVTDPDPGHAAALANAWARAYERHVNGLYGGGAPEQYAKSIQTELEQARYKYEQAQTAVETFVERSQLDRLARTISDKQHIIDSLQRAKQTTITSIVDEEIGIRQAIVDAYSTSQAKNRLLAFNKEQEARRAMIAELIDAETDARLMAFRKDREARVKQFAQYVDAEIEARLLAFDQDRQARTSLFTQYAEAELENNSLAFERDRQARLRLFEAYVEAETNSRLAAVDADRQARSRLFTQYVTAELDNRVAALAKEQEAKRDIFQAYADADKRAKLAVFDQQVQSRLQSLADAYATKLKTERLLADARALQRQARQAGEAGVPTNSLAVLLLKAEAYASSADLPGQLQLQLSGVDGVKTDSASQLADLQALVGTLENRLAESEAAIDRLSKHLFDNQGYELLNAERAEGDPLYTATQQKYAALFEVDELARAAATLSNTVDSELQTAIQARYDELFGVGTLAQAPDRASEGSDLTQAILARYAELFGVGALAQAGALSGTASTQLQAAILTKYDELFGLGALTTAVDTASEDGTLGQAIMTRYDELFGLGALGETSLVLSPTTPLLVTIQEQYPHLFEVGGLAQLSESTFADSAAAASGLQGIGEMLRLDELESLPAYSAAAEPLHQAIEQLQGEINQMRAELERQQATEHGLIQARDLASETYLTMARKQSETDIAGSVTGSEVRFAAPAVLPVQRVFSPLIGVALGGFSGLLLGLLAAWSIEYLWAGQITRRLGGEPGAWWNRAWNWIVTEETGLPYLDKAHGV